MLCRLSIENYALIDRLDIRFASGLNIITGETGAGKSILLGALGLMLGARADASVVQDGTRNCVVEAELEVGAYGLQSLFEAMEVDYLDRTVIRRVITPAGKSRAYINDVPVQLTALRSVGERLIDIHSQHQTLLLGDSRFQVGALDSVASDGPLLQQYGTCYDTWRSDRHALEELMQRASKEERERDYLTFQVNELQQAHLHEGEQAELESEQTELSHAVEIKEALLWSAQELTGADDNLMARLKGVEQALERVGGVSARAEELYGRMRSSVLEMKDIASEVLAEGERLEADPERLEKVASRLDMIYGLQQKYKVESVEALIALLTESAARLADIENITDRIEALQQHVAASLKEAQRLAGSITAARKKAAPDIEKRVGEMLSRLGMPSSHLQIEVSPSDVLQPDGADAVRFLFSANRGGALQPIERVASGGEMSRLMLCLKAIIARHSELPTMIFDEIDTGVSGSIADRMGEIIVALASDMQVINITHLPQVACKGDHHFFVHKCELNGTTVTQIRELSSDERIDEIAKMLSGANVTEAAREQARLLLGRS